MAEHGTGLYRCGHAGAAAAGLGSAGQDGGVFACGGAALVIMVGDLSIVGAWITSSFLGSVLEVERAGAGAARIGGRLGGYGLDALVASLRKGEGEAERLLVVVG